MTDATGQAGDAPLLQRLVEVWWDAVTDVTRLLDRLSEEEWALPTDLPGWRVRDVVAHLAHLEAVLAGAPEETVSVDQPAHARGLAGLYTEQGVVARRDRTPDELLEELRRSTTARHTALVADPPTDASARASVTPGGVPWDWRTLLSNRVVDVWMHEQDVRRAVGQPGGLDTAAADHSVRQLAAGLGFVLGKKVGAPVGTTLVLCLDGAEVYAVGIADSGRGEPLDDAPAEPTVRLDTDRETFVLLAGGRRPEAASRVRTRGDLALGEQVVGALAVTG